MHTGPITLGFAAWPSRGGEAGYVKTCQMHQVLGAGDWQASLTQGRDAEVRSPVCPLGFAHACSRLPVSRMCMVHTLAHVLTSMRALTHLSHAPRAGPPPHLAALPEKASVASSCCCVP